MGPSCRWYIHGDIALGAPKEVLEEKNEFSPFNAENSSQIHGCFMTFHGDVSESTRWHKVGPYDRYKWDEITPISRVH